MTGRSLVRTALSVAAVLQAILPGTLSAAGPAPGPAALPASLPADLLALPDRWQRLDVPGRSPAEFSFGAGGELAVAADAAVAFLYRDVGSVRAGGDPAVRTVSWRWRVDRTIPATDLARQGADDRPLAVHLWFADPDRPSVFGFFGRLAGYPHISHTLTYVFGGRGLPEASPQVTAGVPFANPYYDGGAIVVLRGGEASAKTWYGETRDIAADAARAFASPPRPATLRYIAVSADTDDTATSGRARIAGLVLSGGGDD